MIFQGTKFTTRLCLSPYPFSPSFQDHQWTLVTTILSCQRRLQNLPLGPCTSNLLSALLCTYRWIRRSLGETLHVAETSRIFRHIHRHFSLMGMGSETLNKGPSLQHWHPPVRQMSLLGMGNVQTGEDRMTKFNLWNVRLFVRSVFQNFIYLFS